MNQSQRWKTYRNHTKKSLDDILYEREMAQIAAEKNGGNGAATERYCNCPELFINGKRMPCPPRHNCQYVRERALLVPIAAQRAAEASGTVNGKGDWMRYFCAAMEGVAAPLLR
jgi:hypothetical protein